MCKNRPRGAELTPAGKNLSCNADCCAHYQTGDVACWRPKPGTAIAEVEWQEGLEGLISISAGDGDAKPYTCAATSAGAVRCWGSSGKWSEFDIPTQEGVSIIQLEAGSNRWCAIMSSGDPVCQLESYELGPTEWTEKLDLDWWTEAYTVGVGCTTLSLPQLTHIGAPGRLTAARRSLLRSNSR